MITLLKDCLATYRVTRLVVDDVITAGVREKIFEKYPPHDRSWSYALTCMWCASIWVGLGVVAARKAAPTVWDPVASALGASAVTGLMSERV